LGLDDGEIVEWADVVRLGGARCLGTVCGIDE
jgi:hypothetical protein